MIKLRQTVMPITAAFIWGTAFVAQSIGADYIKPFAFNALRFVIAFCFLLIICVIKRKVFHTTTHPTKRRQLLTGGTLCGIIMAVATVLLFQSIFNSLA
mgnify:CR=1 FL=1